MCYTAILQYIAVCSLDEAIIGHTHMMIMDYGLCVHVCVVCVSMSFAEKNYKEFARQQSNYFTVQKQLIQTKLDCKMYLAFMYAV